MPPDKDGARIAELNEDSTCLSPVGPQAFDRLLDDRPGKGEKAGENYLFTMGEIARKGPSTMKNGFIKNSA